jgi:hypothetical protein
MQPAQVLEQFQAAAPGQIDVHQGYVTGLFLDGGHRLGGVRRLDQDEFFGKVATYRGELAIRVPYTAPEGTIDFTIRAQSQGCADAGAVLLSREKRHEDVLPHLLVHTVTVVLYRDDCVLTWMI